jgi:hypothetical protein
MRKTIGPILLGLAVLAAIVTGTRAIRAETSPTAEVVTASSGCHEVTVTGTVDPQGEPVDAWFEWGPTQPPQNETSHRRITSPSEVKETLSGLTAPAIYYYRLVARRDGGSVTKSDTKNFWTECERRIDLGN